MMMMNSPTLNHRPPAPPGRLNSNEKQKTRGRSREPSERKKSKKYSGKKPSKKSKQPLPESPTSVSSVPHVTAQEADNSSHYSGDNSSSSQSSPFALLEDYNNLSSFTVWLEGNSGAEKDGAGDPKHHGCVSALINSVRNSNERDVSKPKSHNKSRTVDVSREESKGATSPFALGHVQEDLLHKVSSWPDKREHGATYGDADSGGGMSLSHHVTEGRKLHDLAVAHLEREELQEALSVFKKMLSVQRKKHGDFHHTVGVCLHNLGIVYIRTGDYVKAEKALKEAVHVRKVVLGVDHDDVAATQIKLGTVSLYLQQFDVGLSAYRDALRILRKHRGHYDPKVAEILSRIGFLYFQAGELLASQASFEESLDIYQTIQSGDELVKHAFAETLCNVGTIQTKKKQFDCAIASFQKALMLQHEVMGSDNPTAIATMDNLAFSFSKNRNYEQAVQVYNTMLRSQLSYYGHYHEEYSRTLSKICLLQEKQKNFEGAFECTQEILELQKRTLPPNHPTLLLTKTTLERYKKIICR